MKRTAHVEGECRVSIPALISFKYSLCDTWYHIIAISFTDHVSGLPLQFLNRTVTYRLFLNRTVTYRLSYGML